MTALCGCCSCRIKVQLDSSGERTLFYNRRALVVATCIENNGVCTHNKLVATESVAVLTTESMAHKQRGRVVSVAKFRKENPEKTVDSKAVFQKRSKGGKIKDFMKIYNHSDSDALATRQRRARLFKSCSGLVLALPTHKEQFILNCFCHNTNSSL